MKCWSLLRANPRVHDGACSIFHPALEGAFVLRELTPLSGKDNVVMHVEFADVIHTPIPVHEGLPISLSASAWE